MNSEKIAARLIALRGSQSREKTAADLGISLSAVTMYEKGQRIPRDEIKEKIADYYGVSIEDIFFG